MAIHRVFDSPRDRVVFDTGHQGYVHKLLTGRMAGFEKLRQEGGVSGYPSQAESEHDIVENSHASTVPVVRRRARQGLRDPRRGPPRRRGHRRRRPDRRDGLGGAQQHRGLAAEQAGHRRQRQRPLLHPDDRRPDHRADPAAHQPAVRADARPGQEAPPGGPRRRPRGVRRPPRHEEGPQGRARAAGSLRGPRPQVRRPGRRPRPRGHGAGAGPGQGLQRAGDRARDHPQGLRVRRGRAARGRPVPLARARSTSTAASRTPASGSGPTCSPTRWCTSGSAGRTWSRSPRR